MRAKKKDPSKYSYNQYAFRASKEEIKSIQDEVEVLYIKFNKGRDKDNPQGKKAVKNSDIALEALKLGLQALKRRSKWTFDEEE